MSNWVYTRDIPFASHNPSADQPVMQTNANSIDSLIQEDHFGFNDNNGGLHKKVSLVNNAGPFATVSGAGSELYGSNNEWVFTNASLAGAGIFMTNSAAPPIDLAKGSTFLPGGMVMQWGSGVTSTGTFGVFNDTLLYGLSTVYCALTSAVSSGDAVANIAVISPNVSILLKNISGPVSTPVLVYWLVIGKL